MPRKTKPAVVSQVSIGFIDVRINGKSILGGGAAYQRTEYADGTVTQVGGPANPTSISDALRMASEALSGNPATAGPASAPGPAATSEARRRSARRRPAGP